MQAEIIPSPETYIHQCNYYGKTVNAIKLNIKWKQYTKQIYMKQLIQACKSTGRIAVHSCLLSRSERDRHGEHRYYAEKKVYYLFPDNRIPLDIYCKITPCEGQLIYE